jgi:hypothetical protein
MTSINKSGYSHSARSGDNLSHFIQNELQGNGISAAYAPSFSYVGQSAATGLTAAGTNRATALAITHAVNVVGTAASGTGVVLPAIGSTGAPVGSTIVLSNQGANTLAIYAAGSNTIDGTAGSTGITMAATHRAMFIATSSSTWISVLLGAVAS